MSLKTQSCLVSFFKGTKKFCFFDFSLVIWMIAPKPQILWTVWRFFQNKLIFKFSFYWFCFALERVLLEPRLASILRTFWSECSRQNSGIVRTTLNMHSVCQVAQITRSLRELGARPGILVLTAVNGGASAHSPGRKSWQNHLGCLTTSRPSPFLCLDPACGVEAVSVKRTHT